MMIVNYWQNLCWHLTCAVLLSRSIATPVLASDDFRTYQLKQQQGTRAIAQEFQEYKEKEDREFASFLKTRWKDFETMNGKVRIKEPKPKHIPVVKPAEKPHKPVASVPDRNASFSPAPTFTPPAPSPVKPLPSSPKPLSLAKNRIELMFYGNKVDFEFDKGWQQYRLPAGKAKSDAMSAFWTMMSGSSYETTIHDINDARRKLKLDDWGHVTLWREVAKALQPERISEQNLLLWYFLIKSGYDVRLGYSGADVHLFVAVKQQVYATKFTTVGNQTYYAVMAADHGDSIGSFYTYEASYPNKLKPLDIHTASTGFTKTVSANRDLSFEYKGNKIHIIAPYDRELVEYMGSFPQSEFELYFDTDGSYLLQHGLLEELKKHTTKMNQEEAVNFLLAFVQKAFPYKTDDDQFGREKYFFVEETLHYPYNDCEDRSVLFSWLVYKILGIEVVGLVYPGHMTTAVALNVIKPGFATADFQANQYVIADPTYIGATVGMAMPSYSKLKPKKIVEIIH